MNCFAQALAAMISVPARCSVFANPRSGSSITGAMARIESRRADALFTGCVRGAPIMKPISVSTIGRRNPSLSMIGVVTLPDSNSAPAIGASNPNLFCPLRAVRPALNPARDPFFNLLSI